MSLHIVKKDITSVPSDAIVNSTNSELVGYTGVDQLIHQLGGEKLERECRALSGSCKPGEAVYTNAYNLPCRYVIHTVSLPWEGGFFGETAILKSCYRSSLELATKLECRSVSFPLIAAGNYGYPISEAIKCAVTTIQEYLELYDDLEVSLVLFGEATARIAETIYGNLDEYIRTEFKKEEKLPQLDALIHQGGETFMEKLYRIMREKGIEKPSAVYTKAGITKGAFSKLACGGTKNPSLEAAVGLALALKLSYEEAADLLASAGLALSGGSKYDIIISYFLKTGNYDFWELNTQLMKYGFSPILSTATK